MRKCPKCGHKNDNDAKYCSNCREKLVADRRFEKKEENKLKKFMPYLLIMFCVAIAVVIFFFFSGNNTSKTTTKVASRIEKKSSSASTKDKPKKNSSSIKMTSSSEESEKLIVKDLTPEQTAAAIIYYGSKKTTSDRNVWEPLYGSTEPININITKKITSNLEKPGQDVRYAATNATDESEKTAYFGKQYVAPSYTIDPDNTINYYDPRTLDENFDNISAVESVNLKDIVEYINEQHAVTEVDALSKRISIQDNRSEGDGNEITDSDLTNDRLLCEILIFYAISNYKEFKVLDQASKDSYLNVSTDDDYRTLEVTDEQNRDTFVIAYIPKVNGQVVNMYTFGSLNADHQVDLVTSGMTPVDRSEIVKYVNQAGGKRVLKDVNLSITDN
ncbi:MAG: zinc ribbon domain-containing protein [Ligilactobacillus murinus]|nr:zinc ribbon domain-containing protein [Ligilactobacillus murinus]